MRFREHVFINSLPRLSLLSLLLSPYAPLALSLSLPLPPLLFLSLFPSFPISTLIARDVHHRLRHINSQQFIASTNRAWNETGDRLRYVGKGVGKGVGMVGKDVGRHLGTAGKDMGKSVVRAGGDFVDFLIQGTFVAAAAGWVIGKMFQTMINTFIDGTLWLSIHGRRAKNATRRERERDFHVVCLSFGSLSLLAHPTTTTSYSHV